jgi:RimJ/RimL family protein N-acetyltransferase
LRLLETKRLLLRLPEARDADGYLAVFRDPQVVRSLGIGLATPEDAAAGVERMRRHWERHGTGLFSVVRKEDERLLGRVGFLLWDPTRWVSAMREELDGELETEIGWTLGSEHWGKGYATEAAIACRDWALGELGLTRLVSVIAPGNAASIRVAEKIGETLEREDLPGPYFDRRVDLYSLAKAALALPSSGSGGFAAASVCAAGRTAFLHRTGGKEPAL